MLVSVSNQINFQQISLRKMDMVKMGAKLNIHGATLVQLVRALLRQFIYKELIMKVNIIGEIARRIYKLRRLFRK